MPKRKAIEDDTEGHGSKLLRRATGEDEDTEGHGSKLLRRATGEDEEDVEGHSMLPDPTTGRLLAAARERDIQASLRRRALESEARRPFKRNKG